MTNRTPEHLTLYEITKDCPCDECERKSTCVTDCRRFLDYVRGPSTTTTWRQNKKRALAALRRAEA